MLLYWYSIITVCNPHKQTANLLEVYAEAPYWLGWCVWEVTQISYS